MKTKPRRPSEIEIIRPPLPRAYNVILADCPWAPRDKLPGKSRGAVKNYETMTVTELCDYPRSVPQLRINDDAVMFLWRLSSMQAEAIEVAHAWSFDVTSEIIWQKLTKTGKRWFGMGRTVRASHETCLVCTRGRYTRVWKDKSIRSTFRARVPVYPADHSKAGRYWHSAKPPEFYNIVEQACPRGRYIELFARTTRVGWEQCGHELEVAA